MSGAYNLTISGGYNGQTGVVTVPSSLLFGSPSDTTSLNGQIQAYLGSIANGLANGTVNFENQDLAAGTQTIAAGSVGGGGTFEEFTNVTPDSVGGTTAGSGNYPGVSVTSSVTDLVVQVPGNVTLTGVGSTTTAVFGANSNVNYNVTATSVPGTMYLLGGANSISLYSQGADHNEQSIYSAGSDTINLYGAGRDFVTVKGNATIQDFSANAFVTAEGNATTSLYWDGGNSGGTLNFVNNSSAAAFLQIGVFIDPATGLATSTAATHVTAFGGAGGGLFVGGSAGNNSLIGGTGAVTLVGAGNGDHLEASSSLPGLDGSGNDFFAGSGSETMVGTSTTGANLFQVGLHYPGLGQPAGSGVVSTSGSGQQTYFMGNSPGETIYGSTAATAINLFNFVSDATAGGGTFDIYNFNVSNSYINLVNGSDTGAGDATIVSMGADPNFAGQYDITLSDHTTIRLHNFTGSLSVGTIGGGILSLY